ncbi:hypothetical protein Tco_0256263 [Tanacetum coccineum]
MSSITDIKSVLNQKGLDIFCQSFHIPNDVHPQLPSLNQTIHDMPTGKIGVYTRFFEFSNFRLPLSIFLVNVHRHYRINLSQLSVITAAKVSHFEILWHVYDPFPKPTEFSADDYVVLVAHPAPFWKFPEPFLCLIGMSRNYTLDEDTYPTFLHEMDLFAFIQVADPTKVKVGERERAEEEARLLDSTVGCVVPLLPVAPARTESELEASVERLFDDGGSADQGDSATRGGHDAKTESVMRVRIIVVKNVTAERPKRPRKKRQAATDAGGSSHPPKKLRGDFGTFGEAATSGKSPSNLKELLASSMLNVEVGVTAVVTLPMVTYSVSATPEHESGPPTNFITGLNLPTLYLTERFVISSDSSHHSSTNAAEAGIDSFIRSVTPPPVMTEAVTTTNVASIPFAPALEIGTKVITLVYASMFHDSDFTGTVKLDAAGSSYVPEKELSMRSRDINSETIHEVFVPQWNVSNDTLLDDHDFSREFIDHLAPPILFAYIHKMDYHHLFTKFHVGTARQACLNAEVRMDLELEGLNAVVSSLRSQNDGLVDQDAQMNAVNENVAKLDADLLEMACHLEEKIYPHLLTTISGMRWLLTHGMKLFLVKCLNSSDYLTALGAVISRAIEQGMQSGPAAGIDHGKEGKSLTDVAAYNPDTEADFNFAL